MNVVWHRDELQEREITESLRKTFPGSDDVEPRWHQTNATSVVDPAENWLSPGGTDRHEIAAG